MELFTTDPREPLRFLKLARGICFLLVFEEDPEFIELLLLAGLVVLFNCMRVEWERELRGGGGREREE